MVRQEDAVLVLFRMREVVLCSSLSGTSQCFGQGSGAVLQLVRE